MLSNAKLQPQITLTRVNQCLLIVLPMLVALIIKSQHLKLRLLYHLVMFLLIVWGVEENTTKRFDERPWIPSGPWNQN